MFHCSICSSFIFLDLQFVLRFYCDFQTALHQKKNKIRYVKVILIYYLYNITIVKLRQVLKCYQESGLDKCGNIIMISVVLLFLRCVFKFKCVVVVKVLRRTITICSSNSHALSFIHLKFLTMHIII